MDSDPDPLTTASEPLYKQFSHYTLELASEPTGDFRPGAVFSALDVMAAQYGQIKAGITVRTCWATGTTFRDRRHKKIWRVNSLRQIEEVVA